MLVLIVALLNGGSNFMLLLNVVASVSSKVCAAIAVMFAAHECCNTCGTKGL